MVLSALGHLDCIPPKNYKERPARARVQEWLLCYVPLIAIPVKSSPPTHLQKRRPAAHRTPGVA